MGAGKLSFIFLLLLFVSQMAKAELPSSWKNHVSLVNKNKLQENCKPKMFPADSSVQKRGVIVAIHGFTACPQQYFKIAETLWTKLGYDVYTVLLPGHGGVWSDENGFNSMLPTNGEWKDRYGKTKELIFDIIGSYQQGEKVVTGISVGASIATWALADERSTMIDKALIMGPFLSISGESDQGDGRSLVGNIFQSISNVGKRIFKSLGLRLFASIMKEEVVSWGDNCKIDERKNGRAGHCEFYLGAIGALESMGLNILMNFPEERIKKGVKVQLLGVEKDPVVDNMKVKKIRRLMRQRGHLVAACLYPAPANHSLLSEYDTPSEDKFWHTSLYAESKRFLQKGVGFRTVKNSELDHSMPECY